MKSDENYGINMKVKDRRLNVILAVTLIGTVLMQKSFSGEISKPMEAASQCGEITTYNPPPETKDIYFAKINLIDGKTISSYSNRIKLSVGLHKIKVIENIQVPSFTLRRGEMMNYKTFEINIEPNKKYAVGAKYIRENRSKLKSGDYWEPIVWKVSESKCAD